jgi:hypothetical protein
MLKIGTSSSHALLGDRRPGRKDKSTQALRLKKMIPMNADSWHTLTMKSEKGLLPERTARAKQIAGMPKNEERYAFAFIRASGCWVISCLPSAQRIVDRTGN